MDPREDAHAARQLSVADAAYLAGLIDGEGCIILSSRPSRKFAAHQANAMVNVTNTNLELLEAIAQMLGVGHITTHKRGGGWKQSHQFCLNSESIRVVLPQIMPYLRAKKRQAELVLEYLSLIVGRRGIPESDRPRAVAIREEVNALNRRGDETTTDPVRCVVPSCLQRTYLGYDYCFHHWLEQGEKVKGHCQHCGGEMNIANAWQKYCSESCLGKAYYVNVIKPKRQAGIKKKDEQIGFEFPASLTKTCPCGAPFQAKYKSRVYCDQCRKDRMKDNARRCLERQHEQQRRQQQDADPFGLLAEVMPDLERQERRQPQGAEDIRCKQCDGPHDRWDLEYCPDCIEARGGSFDRQQQEAS